MQEKLISKPAKTDFSQYSLQKIKLKIIKTFLDIAILNEMTKRNVVSVPSIIEFFAKDYSAYITAGTVYPIFEKLEKQGYVMKLPNRLTRSYIITAEGRSCLEKIQDNRLLLRSFLFKLIGETGGKKP